MQDSEDAIFVRLREVRDTLKIKVAVVSEKTGLSRQTIYDIFSGKVDSFNRKFIEYLTNELNVNFNWISSGEGNMVQGETKINSNNNTISKAKNLENVHQTQGGINNNSDSDASKDMMIEFLKRENESLKNQIQSLDDQLKRSDKMIEMLNKMVDK